MIVIEELSEKSYLEWDNYVEQHPLSNLYHLRIWQEIASSVYSLKTPFLVARDSTSLKVCGVLPLFLIKNLFYSYLTTGMFGSYGCVLSNNQYISDALIEKAIEIGHINHVNFLLIKYFGGEQLSSPIELNRSNVSVTSILSLHSSPDEMWKKLNHKLRHSIRGAQELKLKIHWGVNKLNDFYDVLAKSMHKKGFPIYGYTFMEKLTSSLVGNIQVLTIGTENKTISGALIICHKDTIYAPYAASLPSYFNMNPNNLLCWEIIRYACDNGFQKFDFGTSPIGSTVLNFKLRWGVQTILAPYYSHAIDGSTPNLNYTKNIISRLFTMLWKCTPLGAANKLGPVIHKYFFI